MTEMRAEAAQSVSPDEAIRQVLAHSQLPFIDRPIDNTALQAYMACPREYFLAMILHRRKRGTSAPLAFGSAWHKALEIHYLTDGDASKVRVAVYAAWEEHGAKDDHRTVMRVLHDYDLYVRKFGKPSKEAGRTVGFPHQPLVEISTNAQGDGLLHPWAGKLDRFVEIGGLVYIEDHKTTSRFDKNYWFQFPLSFQMKGYKYLGKQLLPGEKVAGVRINLSHVLTSKTEFHQQLFTYTPEQDKEWIGIANSWMHRLNTDYATLTKLCEANGFTFETAPPELVDMAFPAHYGDNGCSRKFGMCQYYQVCSMGPRVRMKKLDGEFDVLPWNPLLHEDVEV